jgi:hypothetical protein
LELAFLISFLLSMVTGDDFMILDFFAGSGSSAATLVC